MRQAFPGARAPRLPGAPGLGQVPYKYAETKGKQGQKVGNERVYSQGSISPHSEPQLLGSLPLPGHTPDSRVSAPVPVPPGSPHPPWLPSSISLTALHSPSPPPLAHGRTFGHVPGDWNLKLRQGQPLHPSPGPELPWLTSHSGPGKYHIDMQMDYYVCIQWALSRPNGNPSRKLPFSPQGPLEGLLGWYLWVLLWWWGGWWASSRLGALQVTPKLIPAESPVLPHPYGQVCPLSVASYIECLPDLTGGMESGSVHVPPWPHMC